MPRAVQARRFHERFPQYILIPLVSLRETAWELGLGNIWMKVALRLDETSRMLFFSTEGDTDRENYRKILWDGTFPTK